MIVEWLVKKALDEVYSVAKRTVKETNAKLTSNADEIEASIRHHLQFVNGWSGEVSFMDLKKAKRTMEIFVEPDLYVLPRKVRLQLDEDIESILLTDVVNDSQEHCILLGHPGAGKTTSMKYLCQALFSDDKLVSDRLSFPIVVRFRDLNSTDLSPDSTVLFRQIYEILGLRLEGADIVDKQEPQLRAIKERLVLNVLESMGVLLIFDGFDELSGLDKREEALNDIRKLACQLTKSKIIVTSRTGEFDYSIDNADPYELCPLNEVQIKQFATQWLGGSAQVEEFLKQIYSSPFVDATVRPLTLAHLAAIYERIGEIPKKPKTVYRKIVGLLLEEWDQQRSVKRKSRYANFEIDRKLEFLCNLSFVLTANLKTTVFSKDQLLDVYGRIYRDFDLIEREAKQVVNELETHTGLFLQSSYETFEFAHKSLQEYLAAEYMVRLPSIPDSVEVLTVLPNELAIAVTISSNPCKYLEELVFHRLVRPGGSTAELRPGITEYFVRSFIDRLILEKPDFYMSAEYGLALLLLHNFLMRDEYARRESTTGGFEHLVKSALPPHTVELIRDCFGISKVGRFGGSLTLYRRRTLHRERSSSSREYELVNRLPNEMFISCSILDHYED